jgi:hypothetical protein
MVTERVSVGLGYQYGYATDSDALPGQKDLYEFQSVAALGKISFF